MRSAGGLPRLAASLLVMTGAIACGATAESSPPPEIPTSPFHRTFGPAYPPGPPAGGRLSIDGAILAPHRRSLVVSFIGGKPYKATDACSSDYGGWAGRDGDTLAVQVAVVAHPEQVRGGADLACTAEGYGYVFALTLPDRFPGTKVTDLSSGQLWIPPPDGVAELAVVPDGWLLRSFNAEPSTAELRREYGPAPGAPGNPGRFIALHQAFGGPTSNMVDAPVAHRAIRGSVVPIGRNGDEGYAAAWTLGPDRLWFTVVDPAVTLDAFVEMANGIHVPGR